MEIALMQGNHSRIWMQGYKITHIHTYINHMKHQFTKRLQLHSGGTLWYRNWLFRTNRLKFKTSETLPISFDGCRGNSSKYRKMPTYNQLGFGNTRIPDRLYPKISADTSAECFWGIPQPRMKTSKDEIAGGTSVCTHKIRFFLKPHHLHILEAAPHRSAPFTHRSKRGHHTSRDTMHTAKSIESSKPGEREHWFQ